MRRNIKILLTIMFTMLIIAVCIILNTGNTTVSDKKTTEATDTDATTVCEANHDETTTQITTQTTTQMPTEEIFEINMNFVGDIMIAGNDSGTSRIDGVAESMPETYFFENVRDIFLNDDFTIADCENVYSDRTDLTKNEKGQTAAEEEYQAALEEYNRAKAEAEAAGLPFDTEEPTNDFVAFWFKTRSANANLMKANGIDIVSIDNNHTHDFGEAGFMDTKAALDTAGIDWGFYKTVVYKELNGFRIAFVIGSMFYENCDHLILEDLNEAVENSDYQIVYFHGGTEAIHTPDSWKVESCRRFVDNGADLVVGCHPHVLQPMEVYNGVNIVYSLGNFVFGGNNYPENATAIYNHTITVSKDLSSGKYSVIDSDYTIIPCYVYTGSINNFQPAIIEDETDKQNILDFMDWKLPSPCQ